MAIDEQLFHLSATIECPIVRTYGWTEKAVTIGYFQPITVIPPDIPVWCRRMSGGGVVDHRQDLTFSLSVPRSHDLYQVDRFESYRLINACIASAMGELGLDCWLASEEAQVEDRAQLVCFESPARFDVVCTKGKVCGGAQRRSAKGMLLQGSLQWHLTGHAKACVATYLIAGLRSLLGYQFQEWAPNQGFYEDVEKLVQSRYANSEWNCKR